MNAYLILGVLIAYFLLLILISYLTSRNDSNLTFFNANRSSPWFLVAFGMIGASLSGVTFLSVPGWVRDSEFSYMQMVLGYLPGYFFIANVLLPIYYKKNVISIYGYLNDRFGRYSYKTGAVFFIISRVIGASFRLFLVALVLQEFIFDSWNVPFEGTVFITIALIWIYTFKGGIKTIVWTDTLQTFFMLLSVAICFIWIKNDLDLSLLETISVIRESKYADLLFLEDAQSKYFFPKQFLAGALIAIVMTGLDQDMMQKNLTCRTLEDSQKNMYWFSIILVFVNLLFLSLGALLYIYADLKGIVLPEDSDKVFPFLAGNYLGGVPAIIFFLGVISAAYSSADSALTALTTSFSVDILGADPEKMKKKSRIKIHLGFSLILFLVIVLFSLIKEKSIISAVFTAAGYTYGPLLGLFMLGIFTKVNITDKFVPIVCLLSPLISYLIAYLAVTYAGFSFGFLILLVNGMVTFTGLLLIRRSGK